MMDDLVKKVEDLLKSLLSLKSNAKKDFFVPTIKTPSFQLPKPSFKQSPKVPSALPPPSKKDPKKVAEQLKNPNPGKVQVEVLKVENNGQWALSKTDGTKIEGVPTPQRTATISTKRALVDAPTEGFANHHSPEQKKLIHGLDIHNSKPLSGGVAGAAHKATNPFLKKDVVLKQASGHANQKERGHLDNGFNAAKREVLFHNMAHDYFGMGKHVPTTAGFSRNGEDYSAQEFRPDARHVDLKSDSEQLEQPIADGENPFEAPKQKEDEMVHGNHPAVLNKLYRSGDLHKLALMDNIMGHHDRHGGNYMLEGNDKLHLVDNGTAFDYKNFDTKHSPGYLDKIQDPNIRGMGKDNTELHPDSVKWLNELDPEKAKEILAAHGHDANSSTTQGFLRRLQGMKDASKHGSKHYKDVNTLLDNNRLTSGPLYQHPESENPWEK